MEKLSVAKFHVVFVQKVIDALSKLTIWCDMHKGRFWVPIHGTIRLTYELQPTHGGDYLLRMVLQLVYSPHKHYYSVHYGNSTPKVRTSDSGDFPSDHVQTRLNG